MWTDSPKRSHKTHWLRASLGIWLAAIVWLLWLIAPSFPGQVDRLYSDGLFLWLSALGALVNNLISFSTLELTFAALTALVPLFLVILCFRKAASNRLGILWAIARSLLSLANYGAWLFVLFALLWGLNHWRTPLEAQLSIDRYEFTVETQQQALAAAAVKTNSLSIEFDSICAEQAVDKPNNESMNAWLSANQLIERPIVEAQPMLFSTLVRRLRISGVYNLFLFQPTYTQAQHPVLARFTAQHELAHFSGWAGEPEADLAAYASLWSSDDKWLQYVGWLNFWYATGERKNLAGDVLADIECINQYEQVFKPLPVSNQMWQVYDGYIQATGGEGLKDYAKGENFALFYFWYRLPRS